VPVDGKGAFFRDILEKAYVDIFLIKDASFVVARKLIMSKRSLRSGIKKFLETSRLKNIID